MKKTYEKPVVAKAGTLSNHTAVIYAATNPP